MGKKKDAPIKQAIGATLEFEKLMDSIDFNSYLAKKEEKIRKNGPGWKLYDNYLSNIQEAEDVCMKFTKQENTLPTEFIIRDLFKAKKTRLDARQESRRETEKEKYNDAIHCMQQAFSDLKASLKGKCLIKNNNWAKVLYFNELAICYSGLTESSMSLGYSGQSISMLEELYPELKKIEKWKNPERSQFKSKIEKKEEYLSDSQIINLYTFALYNKGEAERLLHNDDSAMRTFRRITEIYETWKDRNLKTNSSDYYSASLRKALILTDMGRGKEALKALENVNVKWDNFQYVDRESERASVFIDQKEYEQAYKILKVFLDDKNRWRYTFAQRKAKVILLRLLNEFKKNRSEDFKKTVKLTKFDEWSKIENNFSGIYFDKKNEKLAITLELGEKQKQDLISLNKGHNEVVDKIKELWKDLHPDKEESQVMKKIKKRYSEFEKIAKEILVDTIKRKDGDNFKKTCTNLAEYYRHTKKDSKKALNYFYFYLVEDSKDGIAGLSDKEINDWLGNKNLNKLLKDYSSKIKFLENLGRVEDEKYLQVFFDLYVDKSIKPIRNNNRGKHAEIVKKLKDRLIDIYWQKSKDNKSEEVQGVYERRENKHGDSQKKLGTNKKGAPKFIKDFFFASKNGMHAESIVEQMKQNTEEFVDDVVGRSMIYDKVETETKGVLSVLRRWNSFTPALSSSIKQSKGGGYFLYFSFKGKPFGIVIDPGYDFLENFFSQGFKIGDINMILVSHAHPDHTNDLPSILSLFHEMNNRLGKYHYKEKMNVKNLTLILSTGVFEHYNRIIKPSEESLKDIVVVRVKGNDKEERVYENKFEHSKIIITAFGTSHKDLAESQSLGFKVEVIEDGTSKAQIGYTGDAKWTGYGNGKWPTYLKECGIICAHLGSVVDVLNGNDFCNTFCHKFKENSHNSKCNNLPTCKESQFKFADVTKEKLEEQTQKHTHLYLAGLASFCDFLLRENKKNGNLKVAIISEFGEELRNGIRIDLYNKFNAWFKGSNGKDKDKKKPECLPGDIGLEVDVFTGQVRCHSCNRFVERDRIKPIPYGEEEAICFVCTECQSVLSTFQIGEKLKDYCENGRKLELKV